MCSMLQQGNLFLKIVLGSWVDTAKNEYLEIFWEVKSIDVILTVSPFDSQLRAYKNMECEPFTQYASKPWKRVHYLFFLSLFCIVK